MKSPAFQMYPNDWLMDEDVILMSELEEWCYFRMVLLCWKYDSLPASHEDIAKLVGKGGSTTLVAAVAKCFISDPKNPERIRHKRLDKEREKQRQWSEKSKIGGKMSGIARRKWLKGGSQMVEPNTNSSSSPSGEKKKTVPASRTASSIETTSKSLLEYLKPGETPNIECHFPQQG